VRGRARRATGLTSLSDLGNVVAGSPEAIAPAGQSEMRGAR